MELIDWKIEKLQKKLNSLKAEQKASFESVKEHWDSTYHGSLKDKCEMIYMLAQGLEYRLYNLREDLKFERAKVWKTSDYLDFCNIYKGFGSPVGFVSLETGLFDATEYKHKDMWMHAIKKEKERSSFDTFTEKLKTDIEYLKHIFNETVKESGSGGYSTIVEFEDNNLKTGKFFIYLKESTRKDYF